MPGASKLPLGALSAGLAVLVLGVAPVRAAIRRHTPRAPQQCANATVPATSSSDRAMRNAVVCLINQQRTSRGLPALSTSWRLDRSAQNWTNAMVSTKNFWHGINFALRITAVGFIWRSAGENIATGFETPLDVVKAWMASTDHCRNILDPGFSRVGTGINRHPVGHWASGPSTWTQDFALPMLSRQPSGNTRPQRRCPYNI